jgi:hypothetical protein
MLTRVSINPTQLVGILSFVGATIVCLIASRRSTALDARVWSVLAFMNGLFAIEIFTGLRHYIHDLAVRHLMARGEYAQRGMGQEIMVISLIIIALLVIAVFLFGRHAVGGKARLAASIWLVVLALFAIETVSLHEVDAVFYRSLGPILLIGWIWAVAAMGICLAAYSPASRDAHSS